MNQPQITDTEAATKTPLMVWSGRCGRCGAIAFFGADSETDADRAREIAETGPGEYADGGFSWDCMACDGRIDWNGSDPIASVLPRWA